MTVYELYDESGPRHRTTMVHAPALLGCVVVGPTTAAALEETPATIAAFRRFLTRYGEPVDPDEPFDTRVAGQPTTGLMLALPTDLVHFTDEQIDHALSRLGSMNGNLGGWAIDQSPESLAVTAGIGLGSMADSPARA
jgi:hypothetical protein